MAHEDVLIPKLSVPLTLHGSSFSVIEQDSTEEVVQCVIAILRTTPGTRGDDPTIGIPDFAFREGGADLDVIRAVLSQHEPRANEISDQVLEELVATVSIDVAEQSEPEGV